MTYIIYMYIYIYIYIHIYAILSERHTKCSSFTDPVYVQTYESKSYAMFYYTSVSLLHCFFPETSFVLDL